MVEERPGAPFISTLEYNQTAQDPKALPPFVSDESPLVISEEVHLYERAVALSYACYYC